MLPIEHDRACLRVMQAYHESVVHVPGLTRLSRDGRKIKPLGLKEAASIAGLSVSDMGNRVNVNMPEHRPTLEGFVRHLLSGMDYAALDEIESACGRVAITLPETPEHGDLATETVRVGKEFGDVFALLQDVFQPDSDGGTRLTRREKERFHCEVREAQAALQALMAALDEVD